MLCRTALVLRGTDTFHAGQLCFASDGKEMEVVDSIKTSDGRGNMLCSQPSSVRIFLGLKEFQWVFRENLNHFCLDSLIVLLWLSRLASKLVVPTLLTV